MRTAGIIMECNPFHEGHRYIIDQAKQIAEGGPVLVVMSGSFVQRGLPAAVPKEDRVRQILRAGADLVLELPVRIATAGAEPFARGAVRLLSCTGVVTDLVFGSECGDLDRLLHNAEFLCREPEDYRRLLREGAAAGLSYPAARAAAAAGCSGHLQLADTPNDLLGTEYLCELIRQDLLSAPARMQPHAVPRIAADSASSLRERMRKEGQGLFEDDFSGLLLEKLLLIDRGLCAAGFADYAGVGADLANRIHRLLPRFLSWTQFCHLLKSRNFTYTAVSRALTHILLDITKEPVPSGGPVYARLLGCRRESLHLLAEVQAQGLILITGHADADRLPQDCAAAQDLQLDLRASELWDLVLRMKQNAAQEEPGTRDEIPRQASGADPVSEFSKPLIIEG